MKACLLVPLLGGGILLRWPLSCLNDAVLDFELRPDGSVGAVRGFER